MTVRSLVVVPVVAVLAACAGSGEQVDTAALTAGASPDSGVGGGVPGGTGLAAPPPESAAVAQPGGTVAASRPPVGTSAPRAPARGSGTASGSAPPRPAAGGGAPSPSAERPGGTTSGPVDTARGIAAVVGSTPVTQVVVRPSAGRAVTLTGPLANEVGVASGADVWVRGRRVDDRTIEVTSYSVRTVDGQPALTGTLTADGDRLVLVTDDGRRHAIARPPQALRTLAGARVWITGDPGTTIVAYGVLRRR